MAKSKYKNVDERYNDEEKYVQPLSKNNLTDEMFDALAPDVVSETTLSIMNIIPDVTQPRRIVPYEIRRTWDGTPQGYSKLIDAWESHARKVAGGSFPVDILIGKASALDIKTDDPMALNFAELLGFAANIRDIGLNHPIGVVKRGNYHRIVFGERRWTGFQILNHYLGDSEDWSTIPVKITTASEWELTKAQVAENNQSKRPNAIGRAREFAKMLMIARTDGGERYDSWDQLVVPGGCDRAWYAQVSNGELHRIPRNLGPQFEQVLNITVDMMRKYRGLLRLTENHTINDALWTMGDEGDWSENFLREVAQYLDVPLLHEILNLSNGYTVTTVTVYAAESALHRAVKAAKEAEEIAKKAAELAQKEAEEAAALVAAQNATSAATEAKPADEPNAESNGTTPDQSGWASNAWAGKLAYSGSVKVYVKTASEPDKVIVTPEGSNEEFEINISSLREYIEPASKPQAKDLTMRAVQTVTGRVALVQTDANGYVKLRFVDDTTAQVKKEFVSPVDMSGWYAAVRRHNEAKAAGNNAASNVGSTGAVTPTTPTSTPALAVGDYVYLDDSKVIGKIVKIVGDTAHVELSTGVWHYKLNRLTKTVRKASSAAVTIEAEEPDSDDFTPEPEVQDFTPFNADNLAILKTLAEIADVLDIQEADILADLCNLDRTRLERVLSLPGEGMTEVNKWTDIYRSAANTVIFAAMQRVEDHLASISELAQKITKAE